MKHALHEHLRLPEQFADGDTVPILPSDHWFNNQEQAIAALPELFNEDDDRVSDERDA
jgi:hypothetical protein